MSLKYMSAEHDEIWGWFHAAVQVVLLVPLAVSGFKVAHYLAFEVRVTIKMLSATRRLKY